MTICNITSMGSAVKHTINCNVSDIVQPVDIRCTFAPENKNNYKVTIMKKIFLTMVALFATSTMALAQSYNCGNSRRNTTTRTTTLGSYSTNPSTSSVSGYTRSNGTLVNGYTRTQRNNTNHDNFSTSGNRNPFTGTTGSRARDYSAQSYNYGSGHTIQTGSSGGQYYTNSRGNKVYVPKR